MSALIQWVNKLGSNMQALMTAIVAVVSIVICAVLVIKAISCFNKSDIKQAAIYLALGIACFILSAMMAANTFQSLASTVGGANFLE